MGRGGLVGWCAYGRVWVAFFFCYHFPPYTGPILRTYDTACGHAGHAPVQQRTERSGSGSCVLPNGVCVCIVCSGFGADTKHTKLHCNVGAAEEERFPVKCPPGRSGWQASSFRTSRSLCDRKQKRNNAPKKPMVVTAFPRLVIHF